MLVQKIVDRLSETYAVPYEERGFLQLLQLVLPTLDEICKKLIVTLSDLIVSNSKRMSIFFCMVAASVLPVGRPNSKLAPAPTMKSVCFWNMVK